MVGPLPVTHELVKVGLHGHEYIPVSCCNSISRNADIATQFLTFRAPHESENKSCYQKIFFHLFILNGSFIKYYETDACPIDLLRSVGRVIRMWQIIISVGLALGEILISWYEYAEIKLKNNGIIAKVIYWI